MKNLLFISVLVFISAELESQNNLTFTIATDNWGYECSWDLLNSSGVVVQSVPTYTYTSNATSTTAINNIPSGTYTFNMKDSYGDGLVSPGNYSVTKSDGTVLTSGSGNYGSLRSTTFTLGGCSDITPPTSVTGSATPSSAVVNSAITLNGSATDNIGVTKIEWFNGSTLLGSKTGSPYTFSYTFTTVATYNITTKAFDACNNVGTSVSTFAVIISAANPCATNTAPTISSLAGSPSAINLGQSVAFTVSASDANSNLSSVQYYDGTTLIGTGTVSPFSFSTTTLAAGARIITAKAFDACSATSALSNAVTITVTSTSSGGANSWSAITTTDPTYRTGKVHIGKSNTNTGTETSYNLFVTGGIKSEKFKLELASIGGWADYIFQNEYRLMPIRKLEKFIKTNQHLPDFKSASEIVKEGGYEMGDMIKTQQASIEKLHLYIIELEHKLRKMQDLEKRIITLENLQKK